MTTSTSYPTLSIAFITAVGVSDGSVKLKRVSPVSKLTTTDSAITDGSDLTVLSIVETQLAQVIPSVVKDALYSVLWYDESMIIDGISL